MFCKKCGSQVKETQAFCEYCGEKIEPMQSGQQIRSIGYKEYFRVNAIKKVKTTNIIAAVLCFIYILLSALAFDSLLAQLWYYASGFAVMMLMNVIFFVTIGILMLTVKKWIFPLISSCCLLFDIGFINAGISIGMGWIRIWLGILVLVFSIWDVVYLYMFQKEYKKYCESLCC